MNGEKRRELDPMFKQMLLKFLEPFPVTVETEVEVSRLPRTIDVIVITQSDDAHEQLKLHTPFGHFRPHNQIEFKGMSDRLTAPDYLAILGRMYLYMSENKLALTDMSATIVCATKPVTLLKRQIAPHIFTANGAGLYQNDGFPQITMIVINELPLTRVNIPLILFAGNEAKFKEAVLHSLANNNIHYVSYALLIRPQETQEIVKMTNRYEENMKIIARDMGPDMIKYIDPEVLMAGLEPEDRLRGLEPEDRLRGLEPEQMVAFLSMEDIEQLRQLAIEKAVWGDLHTLDTAQERVQLIEQLSGEDQAFILNPDKLDHLMNGLDETEQAAFTTWFSDRTARDEDGSDKV